MPIKIHYYLLVSVAPLALASPANAQVGPSTPAAAAPSVAAKSGAKPEATKAPAEEVFSTGVAKGRDRLDSATSTSSLKGDDIQKLGARSLSEILRNIPGIRAESGGGEGNASYSIRGLPLASSGSKFMQLQEDGLPVLEFGDIQYFGPDVFLRADLTLGQVEAIRGGSASTFASNSPGGVINLISKTGDVEGGAVQTTLGLNYGEHRIDADYGHKLSDTLRFNVGGFYRQGEGPRKLGFDAYKGGQVKFNITKQFAEGYVRLYAKYLDDRSPSYQAIPMKVTGTNDNPSYGSVANQDIRTESLLSASTAADNRVGMHPVVKSVGLESQFDFGGWSFSEKFRFADISGRVTQNPPTTVIAAADFVAPGAALMYTTGPLAGQTIANPATLNGNGLLSQSAFIDAKIKSLDNVTNDLRTTRVWNIGGGALTTTLGFYKSRQALNTALSFDMFFSDVTSDGNAARVVSSGPIGFAPEPMIRNYDVKYDVNAPYGSVNYRIGKLAIGGSIRYDMGSATGTTYTNGTPSPVDYDYHYLSYSTGVNFRASEPLAVFARYSRGGRGTADRILFTPTIRADGDLFDPLAGFDTVKQTELGLKFRKSGVTINVTGFSATTGDRNLQFSTSADGTFQIQNIVRNYSARGVEVEGAVRRGMFSLSAGATYTKAKIASDDANPGLVGNVPRHQARFIFEATPQIETEYATVGVNLIGTTSGFAQDSNELKMPGYTLVNAFVQVRPLARVQLMLNVNNLFDKVAIVEVSNAVIPASGIVLGRAYNGRTLSGSLRYSF